MATITEIPAESKSYVTVDATKKSRPIVSDWYPCHVTKVEIDRRKVKNFEATIYNLTCTVATECGNIEFNWTDMQSGNKETFTGEGYVGKKFRSIGFFNFHEPKGAETFEANPSGNVGYMKLCQAFNMELPKTVVHINNVPTEVLTLPELTKYDLQGKPVMCFLAKSKPWVGRDGKERRSFEVKAFKPWETGQTITVEEDNDMPF